MLGGLEFITIADGIGIVFRLADKINATYKNVKANEKQCDRLKVRINEVRESLIALDPNRMTGNVEFEKGLNSLIECLQSSLKFIEQFSDKHFALKIIESGTCNSEFQALNQRLGETIELLKLDLDIQQLLNREDDIADQHADLLDLKQQQSVLITLVWQLRKEVENLRRDSIKLSNLEKNLIEKEQFASIQAQAAAVMEVTELPSWLRELDSRYIIKYFKLFVANKLTDGSCGPVYRGYLDEELVAIKSLQGGLTPQDQSLFAREVQIITRLKHPAIVQFYGVCLEAERACMVIEYMSKGSLSDWLQQKGAITLFRKQQIALAVIEGLAYLHEQGVTHCNLKSSNVLLDAQGQAKISDFGLAKLHTESQILMSARERSPTTAWIAPECLAGSSFTKVADIYSFGMILWELMTEQKPYQGFNQQEIAQHVMSGYRESMPNSVSPLYRELIHRCWNKDVKKRPTANEIIELFGGLDYREGVKAEKESRVVEAITYYQNSASKGHLRASTCAGTLFYKRKNKAQAFSYLKQSAEGGHPRAMLNLATFYAAENNKYQALFWCERAANSDDAHVSSQAAAKLVKLRQ